MITFWGRNERRISLSQVSYPARYPFPNSLKDLLSNKDKSITVFK